MRKGGFYMFGYVRPYKAELLMREFDEYKAVYCTLCKELQKNYGRRAKFVLSYDITFYTMLALDLDKAAPKVERGRCTSNPLKKCNYISLGELAYKRGAALNVLMSYYKFVDTIEDENFFKSLAARFLKFLLSKPRKKAEKDFPLMAESVKNFSKEQSLVEKSENFSIDACCEPTAKALSQIFMQLSSDKDSSEATILSQAGYFLGRWIYLMDAADDLRDDLKSNSFNPFLKLYNIENKNLSDEEFVIYEQRCNETLNYTVSMFISALNLLDLERYESILENIAQKGLGQVQKEILFLHVRQKNKNKKSNKHI